MTRNVAVALMIALAFLGFADSWYLAQSASTDTALVCEIGGLDGCNAVAQSPYSKLWGIPLADLGLVYYAGLLLLSVLVIARPYRLSYRALFYVSTLGALASLCFLAIQLLLIQALCIYCIASALVTFVAFGVSYHLLRRHAPEYPVVVP